VLAAESVLSQPPANRLGVKGCLGAVGELQLVQYRCDVVLHRLEAQAKVLVPVAGPVVAEELSEAGSTVVDLAEERRDGCQRFRLVQDRRVASVRYLHRSHCGVESLHGGHGVGRQKVREFAT
jgi:hypothetical protein